MGKIYTFINKDHINTKVRTEDLSRYIDEGWSIGNWNQKELNEKSGAGVRKVNDKLKNNGMWEEYNRKRSEKISNTLKEFWQNVSDDYRDNREYKKEQSRNSWTKEEYDLYHKKMSDSARRNRKTISRKKSIKEEVWLQMKPARKMGHMQLLVMNILLTKLYNVNIIKMI